MVLNFTPVPREHYRLGLQLPGSYRVLLNSDSDFYGGSNSDSGLAVTTEEVPLHGKPHSAVLKLPPLAGVVLRYEG